MGSVDVNTIEVVGRIVIVVLQDLLNILSLFG